MKLGELFQFSGRGPRPKSAEQELAEVTPATRMRRHARRAGAPSCTRHLWDAKLYCGAWKVGAQCRVQLGAPLSAGGDGAELLRPCGSPEMPQLLIPRGFNRAIPQFK